MRITHLRFRGPAKDLLPARFAQQHLEPARFRFDHRPAERREPVILPPAVVVFRRRPGRGFFDQPGVEQPLQQRVERPGAQLDQPVGALVDLADDAVAVTLDVGEREQGVERQGRQGEEVSGISFES